MANALTVVKTEIVSCEAGEDLTAYSGVTINWDTMTATYVAANGDEFDGIVLKSAASGEPIEVVTKGIVPVKIATAASVTKYSYLMSNTSGQFLLATTGEVAKLKALQAGGANGNIIQAAIVDAVTIA